MSRNSILRTLCGASSLVLALAVTPAFAQDSSADAAAAANENKDATTDGDIVVTARRKDEALQDVPLVVNAVTAETVKNLEIKRFEDIAKVVPGLVIRKDDTGSSAALRGVTFNPFASGNNATVEFYLNDSAVAGQVLFQTLYDIGQIEFCGVRKARCAAAPHRRARSPSPPASPT